MICFLLRLEIKEEPRRTKKKAITNGGPAINEIFRSISIREYTENKRKLSRVEKVMEESSL